MVNQDVKLLKYWRNNNRKNVQNEACLLEHSNLYKSQGHGGFIGNVSIIIHINKTDGKDPRKKKLLDEDALNLCTIWT